MRIPDYLKADVKRAANAGILTQHDEQAEPVRDLSGVAHDPLARSHAQQGSQTDYDAQGHRLLGQKGRIRIVTRGGEFDPYTIVWNDKYGFNTTRKLKDLTPADLPDKDKATAEDIVSTYRHEMGHLLDDSFRATAKTPRELASEINAWQYAIEISPDHRVSERMIRTGLESHAYYAFRLQDLMTKGYGATVARYDRQEWADRILRQETVHDPEVMVRARAFTERVAKSLQRYAEVLRKRGVVREPAPYRGWYPKPTITAPGRGGRTI